MNSAEVGGYAFKDAELLMQALTHASYVNEHGGKSNERLEYLGDAVLSFIVAEYLYNKYPDATEAVLTEKRKALVSKEPLSEAVRRMGLHKSYRMGKGASMQQANFGDKPLSDIFESVLAAVYIDGGIQCAKEFVLKNLHPLFD